MRAFHFRSPPPPSDCVTSIEIVEHIPETLRSASLAEMRRVLRPGGQLILTVPHAGAFAWLDSNNLRFRFPRLYARLLGAGRRDAGYPNGSAAVVWHHHLTKQELLGLLGDGWTPVGERPGGPLFYPLVDYGLSSYDTMLVLRRD